MHASPGRICLCPAAIAESGGKRFHFSQNARIEGLRNCWKNLLQHETAHAEDALKPCPEEKGMWTRGKRKGRCFRIALPGPSTGVEASGTATEWSAAAGWR